MGVPDFQQILMSVPGIILAADAEGRIVFVSETAQKHLKLTIRQQVGNHVSTLSSQLSEFQENCQAQEEVIYGQNFQLNGRRYSVQVIPIRDHKGPLGVVFSFTEHFVFAADRTGMNEMQLLQLQFDTAFNFADLGIWILNGEGMVLKVNPAAEELIGIKAKDIIGKNIEHLAQKGIIDQALTPHILKSKRPVTKLLHVLKTNKYVMSSGMPVLDRSGNILLVVVNELDITTLKNLQGQLEDLRVVAEKYKDELSDLNLLDFKAHGIISESKEMKQVLNVALKLARFDVSNILILGDSGTGKGLIAKFIHKNGKRKSKPFIQVNCAALPETLLEAELFGFEKGSFTGAGAKGKIGLFEMAQNGTILLDEIGELALSLQSKLLKCLDDHEIMHIGGLKSIKINCTIIAATNQDLELRVAKKEFREDLYHRLNAFCLKMSPLRERPEDIVALSNFFLDKYNRKYSMRKRLSLKAIHDLQQYEFSGNVRELKNILKQGVVIHEGQMLDEIVPHRMENILGKTRWWPSIADSDTIHLTDLLDGFEKNILNHALGQYQSTRKLAVYLNTSQSRIVRMLKKHGLTLKYRKT